MITLVSDTHGVDDHRLAGRTLRAVREAALVVHAGDFTTARVLDAFEAEACRDAPADESGGASGFVGVSGNRDSARVRERLDECAVLDRAAVRIVVVHGHDHDETALGLLARQEDADLVVVGHSHRPGVDEVAGRPVVNPGSHADPRRNRPAHAELTLSDGDLHGRLVQPDGTLLEEFDVAGSG